MKRRWRANRRRGCGPWPTIWSATGTAGRLPPTLSCRRGSLKSRKRERWTSKPSFSACSPAACRGKLKFRRSEEHTSELQSLMRISYAVFCLKKKKNEIKNKIQQQQLQAPHKTTHKIN